MSSKDLRVISLEREIIPLDQSRKRVHVGAILETLGSNFRLEQQGVVFPCILATKCDTTSNVKNPLFFRGG